MELVVVGDRSLQIMDICPSSFKKKNGHMPKILLQNKHVIKERGVKCEKGWDYKSKRGGGHSGRN